MNMGVRGFAWEEGVSLTSEKQSLSGNTDLMELRIALRFLTACAVPDMSARTSSMYSEVVIYNRGGGVGE